MLRQIRYFQAVVARHSFSEAAEECHISQSAISQQIKALESELGFPLLERKNRKFVLTPAGEHFYRKSLVLVADYEQLCRESARIARGDTAVLRLGYPRGYGGAEIPRALDDFAARYPQVSVQLLPGNHEELFGLLRGGGADLVLNDQRRMFSEAYVNRIVAVRPLYVELSARSALAALPGVTPGELKNLPCILVAVPSQRQTEEAYYRTVIGLEGGFLFAETLEEARLLAVSGQGVLPETETSLPESYRETLCRIPLWREREPITCNQCLFWKKESAGPCLEAFAALLQNRFSPHE